MEATWEDTLEILKLKSVSPLEKGRRRLRGLDEVAERSKSTW